MKKLFITILFAGFSFCAFSQTIKISKDGKSAVEYTPAVKAVETPITKEQLMEKKLKFNQEIKGKEQKIKMREQMIKINEQNNVREKNEITLTEKEISDLKLKLAECESVCVKLGYSK